MTIGKKMGLGFGVLLAFVVTLAVVDLIDSSNMNRQYSSVIEHDDPIIANARHLSHLVVDMETGQRGFVITGNDDFLEPYENALLAFDDLLLQQKALVSDNPSQLEMMDLIGTTLQEWQDQAATPEIAMRRKIRAARADTLELQDILGQGVGKGILDTMRSIATGMGQSFGVDGNMHGVFLLERIQKCLVDQETGERGFLITGKETFLEPYHSGQELLQETFSELRILVANAHGRASTINDLDELERLHDKWTKQAAEPEMELRRQVDAGTKRQEDIQKVLREKTGKSTLDELRGIVAGMSDRFTKAGNERLYSLAITIAKAVIDQETGQRGYLITGRDEFLEPYATGKELWTESIAGLRALNENAYDIATMRRNIDRLETLSGEWNTKAALPEIAVRRVMNEHPETLQDVAALLEARTGKRLLDRLREYFRKFIAEAERLRSERFAIASRASETTTTTTISLALVSLVLGGFMAVAITRSITGPVRKLAGAVELVAKGDLSREIDTKSKDEIGDLSNSFNRMVVDLRKLEDARSEIAVRNRVEKERQLTEAHLRQQQKLESIGTLAGGVAHEINNPITGIRNYALLISERLDPESPLRQFADGIGQESERVAKIVHNLLSFARQDKEAHSPANLGDIVENAVALIGTIIRRDQITLTVSVPDDLPIIKCRSQQIQQVLMNLLINARDALNERYAAHDPNKIMAVTARPLEKEGQRWIRVTVEDHGAGIPDEIRDRLFDPFFTTKDRTKGTGLGLSISHGIVQDHHGVLHVECEPGEYTRFYLDLPVDNGWTLDGASEE